MSADNGYIIQMNNAGKYILQEYFASDDTYPDAEKDPGYVFDMLDVAVEYCAEALPDSEYGLRVLIDIPPEEQKEKKTMKTQKFIRKPFEIEAVQVTSENMEEVAAWCTGLIQSEPKGHYIKVQVHYPLTPRQTKAFAGDWVLKSQKGFKVYTASAFQTSFVPNVEPGFFLNTTKAFDEELTKSIFDNAQELFTTSETVVDPKDAISGKR